MDPFKRATRPPGDYMSRASDPSHVAKARPQREAEHYYQAPGTRVPNNPEMGRQVEMELARDNGQVYEIPYRDGRMLNPPGTGVDFVVQRPAAAVGRMMAQQPMPATEALGDLRWAGQVNGMGGPLTAMPNELVQNPGIAREVQRYGTGQPVGTPLPPAPPAGMEDLQSTQMPFAPVPDMGLPTSQVLGSPADARMPRPGRGASPTAGGRPAVMPQPQRG